MKILFLHGWKSVPGGRKPTHLARLGHRVLNPHLADEDFAAAVRTAQAEFDQGAPDVVVGSSRGGAVAMNLDSGGVPLVLLCPAWKNWGTRQSVKRNSLILHSPADEVIPFADSVELVARSGHSPGTLLEVGRDHRLADSEPLQAMADACWRLGGGDSGELGGPRLPSVPVTVYYLEMRESPSASVAPPPDRVAVHQVEAPSVDYYRFLYESVGRDYHWLSRRKMSDRQLAAQIQHPDNRLYVLHHGGSPAGFAELDARDPNEVELVQFGLLSPYQGRGLGSWFLRWVIAAAWRIPCRRFWLHTCTLDHPAALRTYERAGFRKVEERRVLREL